MTTMITCVRTDPWMPESEKAIMMEHEYFVRGMCLTGGRHYSATLGWDEACQVFQEYKDIVNYYGGGIVELIGRRYDDYEIIKSDVCLGF